MKERKDWRKEGWMATLLHQPHHFGADSISTDDLIFMTLPSLPLTSLPFPPLPFSSNHIPSLSYSSFTSLHFPSLPFISRRDEMEVKPDQGSSRLRADDLRSSGVVQLSEVRIHLCKKRIEKTLSFNKWERKWENGWRMGVGWSGHRLLIG